MLTECFVNAGVQTRECAAFPVMGGACAAPFGFAQVRLGKGGNAADLFLRFEPRNGGGHCLR